MRISEIENDLLSEKQVWARSGKTVVRKFRCSGGQRAGRIVSKPAQCHAAIDIKKRMQLKRTKARMGAKMIRKAKKTKRTNPASMRLKALNKSTRIKPVFKKKK